MARRMFDELKPAHIPSWPELKVSLRRQASVLAFDEERAIRAVPRLVPDKDLLRRGLDTARQILGARGDLTPAQEQRFAKLLALFGLDGTGGA
jgi:hypothetical protein